MTKYFLLPLLIAATTACAQSDTTVLSQEKSREILSKMQIDTAGLVRQFAGDACKCADSITLRQKNQKEIAQDIADCIDEQVSAFQLTMKLMASLKSGASNNKINLDIDKQSSEYRHYYFMLEEWLKDSCQSVKTAVAVNNEQTVYSMSKDPDAVKLYNKGIEQMREGNLAKAADLFEKALKKDEKFAFAWDNLGICYRKLEKYEDALRAYNKSLEYDPTGVTPLHNIPVVYEYQQKYAEALKAYARIGEIYPDDAEAFYGAGRIYAYFSIDYEKALENMCKAYRIYAESRSPYRVDAEKNISYIFGKMKEQGKEARFYEILKANGLNPK